jgi:hypothetical protein
MTLPVFIEALLLCAFVSLLAGCGEVARGDGRPSDGRTTSIVERQ